MSQPHQLAGANNVPRLLLYSFLLAVAFTGPALAQSAPWHARDRQMRRVVQVGDGAALVQVEMLLHGRSPASVLIYARRQRVPFALLQHGPGDLVRVAFRPRSGQRRYWLYFGGAGGEQRGGETLELAPPDAGLLLETRRFQGFDLSDLDALRRTFQRAEPIGAMLVDRVFHAFNPCAPEPAPFMSHYIGTLYVEHAGQYQFFTTSQDCSFLLIDGRLVAAAPGRHRAVPRARFGGKVQLDRGPHRFEYWHAASGTEAVMVAAWQPPGSSKPVPIPPQAFGADQLVLARPAGLEERGGRDLPDFFPDQLGVVQIPDPAVTLARVAFRWRASPALARQGSITWDFGDGQTLTGQTDPVHIYLHPGTFTVQVRWRRTGRPEVVLKSQFRVWPLPPRVGPPDEQDSLKHYLNVLVDYDPARLKADSLVALVRVWWYAEQWDRLADSVLAGLASEAEIPAEQLDELVNRGLHALRFRLGEERRAVQLLRLAVRRSREQRQRFRLQVRLAELLLDLGQAAQAERALVAAEADQTEHIEERRLWLRVQADLAARKGKGGEARALYRKAAALRSRSLAETLARRGGYERTVVGLIKEGRLREAYEALCEWADEFPESKQDGSWHLAAARLALARKDHHRVIRIVADALTVAPDSSYADQLVWLEAQAALETGDRVRAIQAARTLIEDYPGSPLVSDARRLLDQLQQ